MSICRSILSAKRNKSPDYYSDMIWAIKRLKAHLVRNRYKESRANALTLSYLGFFKEVGEEILHRLLEKKDQDSAYRMLQAISEFLGIFIRSECYHLSKNMDEEKKRLFLTAIIGHAVYFANQYFGMLSTCAEEIYDFDLEKCLSQPEKIPDPWDRYNHYSHLTLTPMICLLHDSMEGFVGFVPVATLEEAKAAAKADRMKKVRYACIGYRKDDGKAEFLYISKRPEQAIPPSLSAATKITWDGSREYHLCRHEA